MIKRRSLMLAPLAAGLASPAIAQAPWPNRPVRVIVGFPPGGSLDAVSYTHLTLPTNREV